MKFLIITGLLLAAAATGCTSNAGLNKLRGNDALFKAALAKEITAKPNSFDYALANYFVKDGKEYLSVDISRADFKATIPVLVNNWDKMAGIKSTKGTGYRGAGLKGLKLALVNNTEFEYKGLDRIAD